MGASDRIRLKKMKDKPKGTICYIVLIVCNPTRPTASQMSAFLMENLPELRTQHNKKTKICQKWDTGPIGARDTKDLLVETFGNAAVNNTKYVYRSLEFALSEGYAECLVAYEKDSFLKELFLFARAILAYIVNCAVFFGGLALVAFLLGKVLSLGVRSNDKQPAFEVQHLDIDYFSASPETLEEWANGGDVKAQIELATSYFYGNKGLKRDMIVAYKWALVAASRGDMNAKSLVSNFETYMDRDQIQEGKSLAQEYLSTKSLNR